ncbi:type II 3-dehydroquinate dehydratase [Gangjinia marincola]|uniref:3-dehydroquinate dehydratase n=1 Tax=Gangjinia marincola TaxID=578463 RepID=A0ABN1MGB9_9FLAO
MKILLINGPNLNLLGKREPQIYGDISFEDYFIKLQFNFKDVELSHVQSNHEGDLIDHLQQADQDFNAVVINAGGLSHTSIALGDTIKAISIPVVEVHISNTFSREAYRHHSYLSAGAKGVIVGFGLNSYKLAITALLP